MACHIIQFVKLYSVHLYTNPIKVKLIISQKNAMLPIKDSLKVLCTVFSRSYRSYGMHISKKLHDFSYVINQAFRVHFNAKAKMYLTILLVMYIIICVFMNIFLMTYVLCFLPLFCAGGRPCKNCMLKRA